jgi:hypothetical protein
VLCAYQTNAKMHEGNVCSVLCRLQIKSLPKVL